MLDATVYSVREAWYLSQYFYQKSLYEKSLQQKKKAKKDSASSKHIEKSKEKTLFQFVQNHKKSIDYIYFFVFKDNRTKNLNAIPVAILKNKKRVYLGREIFVDPHIVFSFLKENDIPFVVKDRFLKSDDFGDSAAAQRLSVQKPELKHAQMLMIRMLKKDPVGFLILFVVLYFLITFSSPATEDKNGYYEKYAPEEIEGGFSHLIGLDDVKKEVLQLKDILQNRQTYEKYGIKDTFNIMFSGPAGTGKTRMAMYLAKEMGLPIIVGTGNVETGFVGGGAKNIRRMFNEARFLAKTKGGAIIFLDEAQVLLRKRGTGMSKWEDDSANELLAQLDGVASASEDGNIVFIAASNFNEENMEMDEAMARRFKKKIFFRLPSLEERKKLLRHFLGKIDKDRIADGIDIEEVAKITGGHSPAKLETLVQEASLIAIRKSEKINQKTLIEAFERVNVGITTKEVTKEQERVRETVILHELGHFVCEFHYLMQKHGGNLDRVEKESSMLKISSEAISSFHGALGYVLNAPKEFLKNKKELEEEIVQLYGGLASEEFFFGPDGVTIGAHNDLEKIGSLLKLLVKDMGLYGNGRYNAKTFEAKKDSAERVAKEISDRLYKEAKKRIEQNEELILFLYYHLHRRWSLTKKEMFDLIKEFTATKERM